MRGTRHYVHFYTPACSMYQALDNYQVLKSFVLHKKCMLCLINELCNFYSAVIAAPYQIQIFSRIKALPVPVRLETQNDFFYFVGMVRNDGIIPRFNKIFGFPV